MILEKQCKDCGLTQLLSGFSHDKYASDGYKSTCKKCQVVLAREWRHANAERFRAYRRKRYRENPEKYKEDAARYRALNLEAVRLSRKGSLMKIRDVVFAAYGGQCQCCGEDETDFLTLDHVNRDGAAHRRAHKLKSSYQTYVWARDNGYPDTLRILCHNCNCASWKNGVCPHEQKDPKFQEALRLVV